MERRLVLYAVGERWFVKWTVREVSLVRVAEDIACQGVSYDHYDGGENCQGSDFMINLRGWCA